MTLLMGDFTPNLEEKNLLEIEKLYYLNVFQNVTYLIKNILINDFPRLQANI